MRRARIEASKFNEQSSLQLQRETRLQLRAAVKQAFLEVLRLEDEWAQARDNLRLVEDLLRRLRVQVEVGEAARLELTRAEAETASASTYLRSAQLRLVGAVSALESLIATDLADDVDFIPSPAPTPSPLSLEELKAEMLHRHPAFAGARADVQRAAAQLQTQIALKKPAGTGIALRSKTAVGGNRCAGPASAPAPRQGWQRDDRDRGALPRRAS